MARRPKERPPRIKIVKKPAPPFNKYVMVGVNKEDWEEFRKISRRLLPARERVAGKRGAASAMIRFLVKNFNDTMR